MATIATLRTDLIACGILLALTAAAPAADIVHPEPGDRLPDRSDVTYLDLVRLIVPDIVAVGNGFEGHRLVAMRRVDDDSPPLPADPVRLRGLSALVLGADRLLLLTDLGPSEDEVAGVVPLALFDTGPAPRLLDAVHVALDRDTFMRETPPLSLGTGLLAVTTSSHFNSSQGYAADAMMLVGHDRLSVIDTIYTFSDAGCGFSRTQTPSYEVRPRGAHADIKVTVEERTALTQDDCGEEPPVAAASRRVAVTYRWDDATARYLPDSQALKQLAEENAERF